MPKKSKLDTMKGNVEAQESRLQEALNSFEAAKTHPPDEQAPMLTPDGTESGSQMLSSWDMLERVISLEGDLLSSYREYTRELEKRVRKEEKQIDKKEDKLVDKKEENPADC